jgi:hypothetical protein
MNERERWKENKFNVNMKNKERERGREIIENEIQREI